MPPLNSAMCTAAVLLAIAGNSAAAPLPEAGVEACDRTAPPKGAMTERLHSYTLHKFPRRSHKGLSGCVSFWAMDGTTPVWALLTEYREGAIVKHSELRYMPSGSVRPTECHYMNGQLLRREEVNGGASSKCPEASSLRLSDE